MFYNLKITIRNLRRNSLYSWINIAGLAVSLTAVIFIMLWVNDELSYDKFHRNANRIYRLNANITVMKQWWPTTPAPLAAAAVAEMPEIEKTCRIRDYYKGFWEYNNKKFYSLKGATVDRSFFEMFDFKLIEGNTEQIFNDDLSMIISESQAKILFGDEDPVGKIVKTDDDMLFHITGVMKDMPQNTAFRYDYLVPFAVQQRTFRGNGPWKTIEEDWGDFDYQTFFLLRKNVDAASVADNIAQMVSRLVNFESVFVLQPLSELHLFHTDGQPAGMKTVRLFSVIAILILTIACINYVNLITARASKRRKEVAVKKIIGSGRLRLILQLISETLLLYIAALAISTALIAILFPYYNTVAGKEMAFNLFSPSALWIYGITTAAVILLSGLYPAIHLSSFKPLDAFQGGASGRSKHSYLRKVLVILQFAFSFGLIVSTVVIGLQLHYMRTKDLGYNKENVFTLRAGELANHYEAAKNELMKNPDILGVSGADGGIRPTNSRGGTDWDGKEADNNPIIFTDRICLDFLQMMNIQTVSGNYLSENDGNYILVNEEAVRIMGMDEPIGKRFWMNKGEENYYIIKGVVKDYHFETLNKPIKPLILSLGDHPYFLYVKTAAGGAKSAIASVEKIWKEYNPGYEFNYSFLDDEFDQIYKADLRTGLLLNIFAIIAIFVSCLGLFGLVTYTAETKTKEIGIRKVLGASVSNIVNMLSKEFLILVGIAMLIAFPLAYYWLDKMLQDYAYRIHIGWWMFVLAGVITTLLTLISVGWQAVKAATANPVKAIKSE